MTVFDNFEERIKEIRNIPFYREYLTLYKDRFEVLSSEKAPVSTYWEFMCYEKKGTRHEYERKYFDRRDRLVTSFILYIGAGTVINAEQCEDAIAAGARFVVSPGLSVGAAKVCKENNIPYYPGCVTPTEIMQALELDITTVKFFPANVYGGLAALKALSAPFPQIKFIRQAE